MMYGETMIRLHLGIIARRGGADVVGYSDNDQWIEDNLSKYVG